MGKPKTESSFNAGRVVLSALKKLTKNTGWSTRSIVKFIRLEYQSSDPRLSQKVRKALQQGVRLGLLREQDGRYRLTAMSGLAKRVSSGEVRQCMHHTPSCHKVRQCMHHATSCHKRDSPHRSPSRQVSTRQHQLRIRSRTPSPSKKE